MYKVWSHFPKSIRRTVYRETADLATKAPHERIGRSCPLGAALFELDWFVRLPGESQVVEALTGLTAYAELRDHPYYAQAHRFITAWDDRKIDTPDKLRVALGLTPEDIIR